MSDTFRHKDQGKFHSGILKANEVCESTKQMWNRHNWDRGEYRKAKLDLEDKMYKNRVHIFNVNGKLLNEKEYISTFFEKKP